MTRTEAENAIKLKTLEIVAIAAEYMERQPEYITVHWESNYEGYISMNNKYYAEDEDKPINRHWFGVGSELHG